MNEEPRNNENEDWLSDTKEWFAENVRIVLAIIIVLIIAIGIYFYSNRTTEEIQVAQNQDEQTAQEEGDMAEEDLAIEEEGQEEQAMEEETTQEEEMTEEEMNEEEMTEEEMSEEEMTEEEMTEEEMTEEEMNEEEEEVMQEEEMPEAQQKTQDQVEEEEEVSDQVQEEQTQIEDREVTQQGDSYQVSASAGDSVTTLARAALSQYLQQNPQEGLTAEHKIYIEDYLARRAGYNSTIEVGATRSFSSGEIQSAIDASRNLSDQVLEHLKIYSQKVPNL